MADFKWTLEQQIRAKLAGMAMQALIQRDTAVSVELREPSVSNPLTVADKSVRYADALMDLLKRTSQ